MFYLIPGIRIKMQSLPKTINRLTRSREQFTAWKLISKATLKTPEFSQTLGIAWATERTARSGSWQHPYSNTELCWYSQRIGKEIKKKNNKQTKLKSAFQGSLHLHLTTHQQPQQPLPCHSQTKMTQDLKKSGASFHIQDSRYLIPTVLQILLIVGKAAYTHVYLPAWFYAVVYPVISSRTMKRVKRGERFSRILKKSSCTPRELGQGAETAKNWFSSVSMSVETRIS